MLSLPPDARILVIRLSALGDLVFALPAVQAMRHQWPQARVDWLAEDRCAGLLEYHPHIDEVLVYPRSKWKQARGLRQRMRSLGELSEHFLEIRKRPKYDLILDFQGNLKSALHLLFAPGETTVGFDKPAAKEGAHRFVGTRVKDPGRVPRIERDLALVRAMGYQGPIPTPHSWELPREAERAVHMRLHHPLAVPAQANPDGPVVLLHTEVTSYGQDKLWPSDYWLELTRHLVTALGARVLLLWTPGDRQKVMAKVDQSQGCCALAPPTPSLQHLMALTDQAALLIGTDSGPVHLAAYRGTPVVALYGPTDPQRYAPYGKHVQVVCALESSMEPPPRDRSGPSPLMNQIRPSQVWEVAEKYLSEF